MRDDLGERSLEEGGCVGEKMGGGRLCERRWEEGEEGHQE